MYKFKKWMKILLLILIFSSNSYLTNYMEFEKLLGKSFPVVEKAIGGSFRESSYKSNRYLIYSNGEYFNSNFFGMSSNHLTLLTNKEGTVESISIHFRKVIDRQFYDLFIEKYGKPDHVQIVENRQLESESITKDETGKVIETLRKSTFDLREGTFEEKPLYIIWKKEGFQIKAFLRHEQKISEVTFSVN